MIRVLLLLLGTSAAKRSWPALVLGGVLVVVLGIAILVDALDGVLYFPMHLFGWVTLAVGLATLLASSTSTGTQKRLRQLRALGLVLLSLLAIDGQYRDAFLLAVTFGVAYALDGTLRIAAASVVRFPGWPRAMMLGVGELLLAAFLLEPYPTHYAGTVPYSIGIGVTLAGIFVARTGLQNCGRCPRTRRCHFCCREDTSLASEAVKTPHFAAGPREPSPYTYGRLPARCPTRSTSSSSIGTSPRAMSTVSSPRGMPHCKGPTISLFVGIYTVMLAMIGSRFRGSELVGVYSVMSVAWGIGALAGPAAVGIAMSASPQLGLPWTVGAACALFAATTLVRRRRTL